MAGTDIVSAGRQWTRVVQRSPPEVISSRHQEKGDHTVLVSGTQRRPRCVGIGNTRADRICWHQEKGDHAASASGAQMNSRRVIIGKARSKEEASFDQAKTD